MQSDIRRPPRWRGRVRGGLAAWSVLPVVAVVLVVGGIFWTSVWIVLRPSSHTRADASVSPTSTVIPTSTAALAGNTMTDLSAPPLIDRDAADSAVPPRTVIQPGQFTSVAPLARDDQPPSDDRLAREDRLAQDGLLAQEDPLTTDDRMPPDVGPATEDRLASDEMLAQGDALDPADGMTADEGPEIDAVAAASTHDASGPVMGPPLPEGFAMANAPERPSAHGGQPGSPAAADLTAKAQELTAKAEELTARNDELTGRLEGLTTKIEELQARLDAAARANPGVRPAAVPSPGETVAARSNQTTAGQSTSNQANGSTRSPWVVLPQPEPGSRVTAGPVVLETRARGEAPITEIRLQLDGIALSVAVDRRDDTTWRGRASTRVTPGSHSVAVAVVDGQGRIGTYRWQFDATPS